MCGLLGEFGKMQSPKSEMVFTLLVHPQLEPNKKNALDLTPVDLLCNSMRNLNPGPDLDDLRNVLTMMLGHRDIYEYVYPRGL